MRRLVAILLLSVHLFTTVGYTLVFEYFIHRSDQQIVKEIYDQRTQKKLIEIKIPVNLPNIHPWSRYEHIEGQIQLNGTYYNYVRLKMTRDTMAMICLPNNVKTQLVKANVILAKEISDTPMSKKAHDNLLKHGADVQYHLSDITYQFKANPVFIKRQYNNAFASLLNPFIETRGQPPNHRC